METLDKKTGNGAFEVCLAHGNKPMVQIGQDAPRTFDSIRIAYDWCVSGYADLQGTMRGYSYLNAAYALEDRL